MLAHLQQGVVLVTEVAVHGAVVMGPAAVRQIPHPDLEVTLVSLKASPLVLDPRVLFRQELFLHPLLVELHLQLPQLAVLVLDLPGVLGHLQ